MSRSIPATFVNQNTYGVNTSLNRDRLPTIPEDAYVSLREILIGKSKLPSRLALAALPAAEDEDDIIRLSIGAMLDASGVSVTTARIRNMWDRKYEDGLLKWAVHYTGEDAAQEPVVEESGNATVENPATTSGSKSYPRDQLPEWLSDLEILDSDVHLAMTANHFEVSAYAGIIAYAIGKQPTAQNLEAYNQKRRNVVTQYMATGDPVIFVDDSKYLSLETLGKIHRAFNSAIRDRSLVMSAIVDSDNSMISGARLMFYAVFRLTHGASLNPLLIITKYARKYPHFYSEFRDLETEYHAAAHALQRFYDVPEKRRMYLKLIFGSAYSPVARGDINELLGCATFALQQNETTLVNYNGGTLSVEHRNRLVRLLEITAKEDETVTEEAGRSATVE